MPIVSMKLLDTYIHSLLLPFRFQRATPGPQDLVCREQVDSDDGAVFRRKYGEM